MDLDTRTLFLPEVIRGTRVGKRSDTMYSFLSRSGWARSGRIRDEMERWYAEYPDSGRKELCRRFRSKYPGQCVSAWWELYLHRLFTSLGYELEDHPDVAGTTRHPDFRVTNREGASFLLEAVSTRSGIVRDEDRHELRENEMLDLIDSIDCVKFNVMIELTVGPAPLKAKMVRRRITEWLDSLDPTDPRWEHGTIPEYAFTLAEAGWRIELRPLRFRDWETLETADDEGLISAGPMLVGMVDDRAKLSAKLLDKRDRYGRDLEEPFVVAALADGLSLREHDVLDALLGHTRISFTVGDANSAHLTRGSDGMWLRGSGSVGDHVSAVLIGAGIWPWSVGNELPTVWPNPWTAHPLPATLPLPSAIVDTETLNRASYADGSRTGSDIFALAADWPGQG